MTDSTYLEPLLDVLRDLVAWVKAQNIPGAGIGGVAAGFLGRPRVTRDVDAVLLLDISDADKAKTHFSELLDRVERGEEVTITKHGSPVAKLVPVRKTTTQKERRAAIDRWRQSSKGLTLGGLKIRNLVEEGRP